MITLNEFYYTLSALGTGIFFTAGLASLFRHGFKYPYSQYIIVLIYVGICFMTFFPIFDSSYATPNGKMVHELLTSMLAPLLMTVISSMSKADKHVGFVSILALWLPFVLCIILFYMVGSKVVNAFTAGLIVISSVTWMVCVWKRVNEYTQILKDNVSDSDNINLGWMRFFALIIAVATIVSWGCFCLLPEVADNPYKLDLISMLFLYMPLFMLFEYFYEHNKCFEDFESMLVKKSKTSEGQHKDNAASRYVKPVTGHAPAVAPAAAPQKSAASLSRPTPAPAPTTPRVQSPVSTPVQKEANSQYVAPLRVDDDESPEAFNERISAALTKLESRSAFYLGKDLTVADLAKKLNITRNELSSCFHDKGTTFFDYIEVFRVTYAYVMLEKMPNASIDNIAFKSGFGFRSAFNRAFSNYYHTTPAEYRKSLGL